MTSTPFVEIGRAGEAFASSIRGCFDAAKYPSSRDWLDYRASRCAIGAGGESAAVDVELAAAIGRSREGITFLIGNPGTGKTFHALLFGIRWAKQSYRGLLGLSPERRGFYTLVGQDKARIGGDALRRQWDGGNRKRHCLWVMDDLNNDEHVSLEAYELFREEGLFEQGHHLLMLGWAVPRFAATHEVVQLDLTEDSVQVAARTHLRRHVAPELVDRALKTPAVGLKEILHALQRSTAELEQFPERFQDFTATERLKDLKPDELRLAYDIARLKFLGAAHPVSIGSVSAFDRLRGLNLAMQIDDRWETGDEQARVLLRAVVDWDDLAGTLFLPLVELVEQYSELTIPVLQGLRSRRTSHLSQYVGGSSGFELAPTTLLDLCLKHYGDRLGRSFTSPGTSLADLGTVVQLLSLWPGVKRIADFCLQSRQRELTEGLTSGNYAAVSTALRLAQAAGDGKAEAAILDYLTKEFVTLSRARFQRYAERVAPLQSLPLQPELRGQIYKQLLPQSPEELAHEIGVKTPNAMFKFLIQKMLPANTGMVHQALSLLPVSQLAHAIVEEPVNAKALFERRSIFAKVLRDVFAYLEAKPLAREDVGSWSAAQLVDFLQVAVLADQHRILNGPLMIDLVREAFPLFSDGSLRDLVRAVSRSGRGDMRSLLINLLNNEGARPLTWESRVLALALLDEERARSAMVAELVEVSESYSLQGGDRLSQAFWLIWEAKSLLVHNRRTLVQSAVTLADRWQPPDIFGRAELMFEGILADTLHRDARAFQLSMGWTAADLRSQAFSPQMTVSQIAALCRMSARPEAADEWLEALVQSVLQPGPLFKYHWKRLSSRSRAQCVDVFSRALKRLWRSDPRNVILSRARDDLFNHDRRFFWNAEPGSRLDLAYLLGGKEAASGLLAEEMRTWASGLDPVQPASLVAAVCWSVFIGVMSGHPERARYLIKDVRRMYDTLDPEIRPAICLLSRWSGASRLSADRIDLGAAADLLTRVLGARLQGDEVEAQDMILARAAYTEEQVHFLLQ